MIGGLALVISGCSQLTPPNSKQEAHDRWSSVRAQLKYQLASDRFKNGHLDEAYETVQEAIGLNPRLQESYVLLTRIQLERGEIALAAETLSESLTYGADTPETDYLSGVIAERYRRFEDALKWYEQASMRDTLNAHYVAAVAETLVALDRNSEALELVKSRWTDFEQNATLRALAGSIYHMLGDEEAAANAYRQAYRIAPEDSVLGFQLGSALTMAERYEEALEVFSSALEHAKLVPTSTKLMLGRCQFELGRHDEAKQSFQDVVAQDGNSLEGWDWLSRGSLAVGDLLTARRAASQAVQLSAGARDHLMLLGYVCYRQKDYVNAKSALDKAARIDPKESVTLCLLGQCYEGLGNAAKAETCYRQALQADPDCEWAKQLLERRVSSTKVENSLGLVEGGIRWSP
jgi:tetratricopeptide (TPR) repeat protein